MGTESPPDTQCSKQLGFKKWIPQFYVMIMIESFLNFPPACALAAPKLRNLDMTVHLAPKITSCDLTSIFDI